MPGTFSRYSENVRSSTWSLGNARIETVTFIDWSDAEGMFGLLVDFVADVRAECRGDPQRLRFVEDLLTTLRAVEAELARIPTEAALQRLKDLQESADAEFSGDPVMVHLNDLIDELERITTT